MRISDWSSDVCSSDLRVELDDEVPKGADGQGDQGPVQQAWAVPVGPTARPIEQEDHRDRQQQEEPAIGADPDPAQEARAGGVDIEGGKEDRDENQDTLGRSSEENTSELKSLMSIS